VFQAVECCLDADNDGYSDGACHAASCTRPPGYKTEAELFAISGDCNDDSPDVNPGVAEICNGIDDNCDDQIDGG